MVKIKFNLKQATETQKGSRGIALLFLQTQRYTGWMVNTTTQPFYSREGDSVLIVKGVGWNPGPI
jgi:hypothetical protein